MTDQNNDNQFDEFRSEDYPAEETTPEEAAPAAAGGSNRNFMIGIGVIAAILVLALIGMGVFAATVLPRSRANQAALAATLQAQNEITAVAATQDAFAALQAQITPSATPQPTATLAPTRTPVVAVASATSEPTLRPGENKAETPDPTLLAAQLTAGTEQAGGGGPGTTPLAGGAARTATLAVLLTQAAANQQGGTQAASSVAAAAATATALPATGFADEVGLPGLFGLALGLIILIFLSRTLRLTSK